MIKIAHIATADFSIHGLLLRQLCYLRENGYDVTTISNTGSAVGNIKKCGFRHIAVDLTRRFTPVRDIIALYKLYKLFRQEKFEIIHTHTPKANLLGQLAAKIAGIPIRVSTVHGLYLSPEFSRFKMLFFILIEKISAMFADIVFLINGEDVIKARQYRIIDGEKIRLLDGGIGINIEKFNRLNISDHHISKMRTSLGICPEELVVGFVGRLVQEKGLIDLFKVAKQVKTSVPNVRFLIVGSADLEKHDAIRPEMAREYGVEEICIFTGERKDTPELYAIMDVLFLPSHREGFGLVLAEAAAMGVPAVASDLGGCRQSVKSNYSGYLIPVGDIDGFTEILLKLLKDPEMRTRMGKQGEQLARDKFDDSRVNRIVMNEYHYLRNRKELRIK
jgi:glycosyltransferase involved in cell wall biosynthesis